MEFAKTRSIVPDERTADARDLLTLDEVHHLTGWGKTKLYEAARSGSLPFPTLRVGRRFFFSRRAYENWRDTGAAA